jgi:NTE family protein
VLSWLNAWGGEVRTLARVGSVRSLLIQPWQPLAPGSPWHFVPSVQYKAASLDVYEDRVRTLRVGYEVTIATLAFGRQFGNWGNVQLGVDRRVGRARSLLVTDGTQTEARLGETARYAQFQIDTLDSLVLPSRGLLLQGRVERIPARPGEAGRGSSSWVGMQAFRVGDWASHVYAEWSWSRSGLAPLSLGGFLRLSGTPRESVEARELVLGRLTMARRIGDMPAGLGGAVRTGFSLELGAGYDRDNTVDRGELQRAGSLFVSVDTRFGPVFLALGSTRHVGNAIYLFLGPFW